MLKKLPVGTFKLGLEIRTQFAPSLSERQIAWAPLTTPAKKTVGLVRPGAALPKAMPCVLETPANFVKLMPPSLERHKPFRSREIQTSLARPGMVRSCAPPSQAPSLKGLETFQVRPPLPVR